MSIWRLGAIPLLIIAWNINNPKDTNSWPSWPNKIQGFIVETHVILPTPTPTPKPTSKPKPARKVETRERADTPITYAKRQSANMFGSKHWSALYTLWLHESGWNYKATNPSSGAYGIPQALPASKMASAGDDWRTNFRTQIDWGLDYIVNRYGNPTNALNYWNNNNYY